jgi:hypothetical protein
MHHAMNHVRFMISPELHVVQDRVHGSPEPHVVQGAIRNWFNWFHTAGPSPPISSFWLVSDPL